MLHGNVWMGQTVAAAPAQPWTWMLGAHRLSVDRDAVVFATVITDAFEPYRTLLKMLPVGEDRSG